MTPSANLSVDKILTTKEFVDFLNAAKNFCSLIESHSESSINFLLLTQSHLLQLYSLGLRLPNIDLQTTLENDPEFSDTEFKQTLEFINDRVSYQFYWHVFDPTDDMDTEASCGDLADDLGDIYIDIKRSLLLFNLDKAAYKENAIWQFKFDFLSHWGDHCVNAIYAIHYFSQKHKKKYGW